MKPTPTLWREGVPRDPTFERFNCSLAEDWFLLPHELALQRAHAETLHAAGIYDDGELDAVIGALSAIETETRGRGCPESDAEDIHSWIEHALTERAGAAGRKIHTARSRNDQVATLLVMYAIDRGEHLADLLDGVVRTMCGRAKEWSELAFPIQTHSQFAMPGSVGFWMLRHASALARSGRVLRALTDDWREECPLGSGAVAGSTIPIDRTIQARRLGFRRPSPNAMDATTSRDACLDLLYASSKTALGLQGFATDVVLFAQTPFGWVDYPLAFGTGSSMMPNKRNPDAMELMRGECAALHAALVHGIVLLKGLPSGYQRDLQCIKPTVRDAAERSAALLELAAAFVRALAFDPERLADSMQSGDILATHQMEALVRGGVPLRDAHHEIAGDLAGGTGIGDAPLSAYATLGSPAPDETRRVADRILETLTGRR